MGLDITGLGSIAELVTTTVNKIWPDKTEQEKAEIAAAVQTVVGQLDINKQEAASSSMFVAGWRPWIGWVCGVALAYQYLARPLLTWGFAFMGKPIPLLPGLDGNLWELMLGMLGLGGLRSWEKTKGVAK